MLGIGYNNVMSEETERRASFGEAVRYRRKLLGLTQGEVARLMSVSQNTMSRWEIAARAPDDPYVVEHLAKVLHADPADLRDGIIRTERRSTDLKEQLVGIALQHAQTPEDFEMLLSVIEKALSLNPDGLRRVEDYIGLLAEHFGRGEAGEEDDAPEVSQPG